MSPVKGVDCPEGALGYFLGGYVPPGAPNWHPVLKKFPPKLIPRSRMGVDCNRLWKLFSGLSWENKKYIHANENIYDRMT